MDEQRKRRLRYVLGVLVIALALGAIFAATALARGGNRSTPAAPAKAKATRTAETPAKAKAYSGRGHCDHEFAVRSQDV